MTRDLCFRPAVLVWIFGMLHKKTSGSLYFATAYKLGQVAWLALCNSLSRPSYNFFLTGYTGQVLVYMYMYLLDTNNFAENCCWCYFHEIFVNTDQWVMKWCSLLKDELLTLCSVEKSFLARCFDPQVLKFMCFSFLKGIDVILPKDNFNWWFGISWLLLACLGICRWHIYKFSFYCDELLGCKFV